MSRFQLSSMLAGSPKNSPNVEKISALFLVAAARIHQIGTMVYRTKSPKNIHVSSQDSDSRFSFPHCKKSADFKPSYG